MELTDEGRKVLEIVRRVLVARTHWATWGQTLRAEIEVEVKKLGRSLVFAEASFRAAGSRAIAAQAVATWAVIP